MQVSEGLDIVTSKATKEEQRGVPNHVLGIFDPYVEFKIDHFCDITFVP